MLTSMTSRARVRGLLVEEAAEGPHLSGTPSGLQPRVSRALADTCSTADKHQLHTGTRLAGGGPNSKFTRP